MRLQRIGLIFLAVYLVFVVGGYATAVPEIRWFNHIFLTVISCIWLAGRIWQKRNLPQSPLNPVIFAMLIVGFLAVPFSVDPRMALENMWIPVIYTLMFLFIVNAFHHARHKLIIEILFFITALVIFLSFVQIGSVFFGWGVVRDAEGGWINWVGQGIPLPLQSDLRIFLPLGVSTQTAGFIAPVIVIALAHAVVAKKLNRILLILMMIILSVLLLLTFSRGGLVSLGVGLISFVMLQFMQSERAKQVFTRRNLTILSGVAILILAMGATILYLSSIRTRVDGDNIRQDLWRSAIAMVRDNPLTGVGPGLYGRSLREYRNPEVADDRLSTAHNIYLNTSAEHGIAVPVIVIASVIIIATSWWRLRQKTPAKTERWYLLNGMMAALIGFAVHNLFDTLSIYATTGLASILIVYATVEPAKSRLAPIKAYGNRIIAIALFVMVALYGIWFALIVDPAHRHFVNSLNPANDQLLEAETAVQLDPSLHLYTLQVAYLAGQNAYDNPASDNLADAIELYRSAIELEPTWTTGMMNLAALLELEGNSFEAEAWLQRAYEISPRSPAGIHFARLAELNGNCAR